MVGKPTSSDSTFVVKVSPRGATRLKDGHVWVYRSDIVCGIPAAVHGDVLPHDHLIVSFLAGNSDPGGRIAEHGQPSPIAILHLRIIDNDSCGREIGRAHV